MNHSVTGSPTRNGCNQRPYNRYIIILYGLWDNIAQGLWGRLPSLQYTRILGHHGKGVHNNHSFICVVLGRLTKFRMSVSLVSYVRNMKLVSPIMIFWWLCERRQIICLMLLKSCYYGFMLLARSCQRKYSISLVKKHTNHIRTGFMLNRNRNFTDTCSCRYVWLSLLDMFLEWPSVCCLLWFAWLCTRRIHHAVDRNYCRILLLISPERIWKQMRICICSQSAG